jgi:hypothetical protein
MQTRLQPVKILLQLQVVKPPARIPVFVEWGPGRLRKVA